MTVRGGREGAVPGWTLCETVTLMYIRETELVAGSGTEVGDIPQVDVASERFGCGCGGAGGGREAPGVLKNRCSLLGKEHMENRVEVRGGDLEISTEKRDWRCVTGLFPTLCLPLLITDARGLLMGYECALPHLLMPRLLAGTGREL